MEIISFYGTPNDFRRVFWKLPGNTLELDPEKWKKKYIQNGFLLDVWRLPVWKIGKIPGVVVFLI